MTSGLLRVSASHDGVRTVVDTLRQEGLARCSRPFAEPDGAARIVTAQYGPGFVRGDCFRTEFVVGERARLVVAAQSAARALGYGAASTATTNVDVGTNAHVYLAGEPLVAYADASHRAMVTVNLAPGGSFAMLDCVVQAEAFVTIATSLEVNFAGRLVLHDAMRLTPRRLTSALGSAYFLRGDVAADESNALAACADAVARDRARSAGIAFGIDTPAAGGVIVRAVGPDVRTIRGLLADVLGAVCARDAKTVLV